jgi:hypothetical protein
LNGTCGYITVSPCSGFNDPTTSTSGTGAANPIGDAQGQAYFSQNASADNENWMTQTSDRFNSFSWFVTGVPAFPHGMAMSDDADMNDAYQFLAGKEYGDGGQLTRLPGAVGPDASFYHTVSAKEKAPKPKADDGGQGDDDKSGNQGEEAPSASDYLFKLQTRQTGNGSTTVDTTQLVNPSRSNLQAAADDASKNDEVGGSKLGDAIDGMAQKGADDWNQLAASEPVKAAGEMTDTVDVVGGLTKIKENSPTSDTVGLLSDLYDTAKELKEKKYGEAAMDMTLTVIANSQSRLQATAEAGKAYKTYVTNLLDHDIKAITNAANTLGHGGDE